MSLNTAWQEAFEERAAIMQYDGKLARATAEMLARKIMPAALPQSARISKQYLAFREFWYSKGGNHASQ